MTTTRIIRIGNSQGIRIPKAILEQAELPEKVVLRAELGRPIVTGARQPRSGWADAARDMRALGNDRLLDPPQSTGFDLNEWEW